MAETYLPAFKATVQEGEVESVMGAYNRVNGEPSCGSKTLLKDTLRDEWGFQGHVVSDCWAIRDFHENHKVTSTAPESAASGIPAGYSSPERTGRTGQSPYSRSCCRSRDYTGSA